MVLWLLGFTQLNTQIYEIHVLSLLIPCPQLGLLEPGPALGPRHTFGVDATSQAVCRSADSDLRLGRLPRKRWGQVMVIKLMIPLKPDQHPGVESLQHHLVVLHVSIDLPCHFLR